MDSGMTSIEVLEARVRTLERSATRWRAFGGASVLALGTVLLGAMQTASPKELNVDVVRTQKIELLDDVGNVRGTWGPEPRFGNKDISLTMRGPEGTHTRVMLFATDEAALTLTHSNSPGVLYLFADDDAAGLSLSSRGETSSVGPTVQMTTQGGDSRFEMRHVMPAGYPSASKDIKSRTLTITPDVGVERREH